MQRLEGLMRKAIQEYGMIAPGDRVCVGVSGGKDQRGPSRWALPACGSIWASPSRWWP